MDSNASAHSTPEAKLTALEAVLGVLYKENELLSVRPDLLWQCMYNRLQWEGQPIQVALATELEQRRSPGAREWLRLAAAPRESSTLEHKYNFQVKLPAGLWRGHVEHCVFSPGGTYIAASGGSAVIIWDRRLGSKAAELVTPSTRFCAFGPKLGPKSDSTWFVTLGDDVEKSSDGEYVRTIAVRRWDTRTWKLQTIIRQPKQEYEITRAGAISGDGR